ncbi:MAG: MFS transporter [Hyphomonadaceae bacterium]|jgi:predicted MFS family arabinose efflux permease|nr:MFS transporter [Hyphomonadaceae bacterium]
MQERQVGQVPSALGAFARHPATAAILALGITQIVSWGTTLYALGVLAKPIAADTGWSQSLVFGGLTVGLLVSSATSPFIGRLIDRRGGQLTMAVGSVLVAVGLVLLALVVGPATYLMAWAFLGLAMRMTLYDAAFAALVQVTPSRGRRAISYLTLFGGLASSVFWPIGHALNGAYGWRTTLIVFALINLLVCLPLHWLGLARRETAEQAEQARSAEAAAVPAAPPLEGPHRMVAMALFSVIIAASALVFGALAVHLVPILEAAGLSAAAAVLIASLKGPAQVAGRVWDLTLARRWHPIDVGRVSVAFMPLSFLVLMFGGASLATALAFTLIFGISNGLVTIMRGAVPLALFGAKGYGAVLGILATPYLLLAAVAPALFALVVEHYGYRVGEAILFIAGLFSCLGMELMALWYRRRVR